MQETHLIDTENSNLHIYNKNVIEYLLCDKNLSGDTQTENRFVYILFIYLHGYLGSQ